MLAGVLVYCVIDSYEPAKIPVVFDVKNIEKYPLHKSNFFAKDSGDWHYVLQIPEGVRVYGMLTVGTNIHQVAQALGLDRSDLSEDWVGVEYGRRYFVDSGDIYELEFAMTEYALGHQWGYSDVDVKFIRNYWQKRRIDGPKHTDPNE
jgi:hypothetical protein